MSGILLTEEEIRKIISEMLLKESLASSNIFSKRIWSVSNTRANRRASRSDRQRATRAGAAMDCYFCEDPHAHRGDSQICNGGRDWDVVDSDFREAIERIIALPDIQSAMSANGITSIDISPAAGATWRSEDEQLDLYDKGTTRARFSYHNAIKKVGHRWKRAALGVDIITNPKTTTAMEAFEAALAKPNVIIELANENIEYMLYPSHSHVHFEVTSDWETLGDVIDRYRDGEDRITKWAERFNRCERQEFKTD